MSAPATLIGAATSGVRTGPAACSEKGGIAGASAGPSFFDGSLRTTVVPLLLHALAVGADGTNYVLAEKLDFPAKSSEVLFGTLDLAPDERKLDERFAPLRSAKSAALFQLYRQFNFACVGGGAFFFTAFRNDSATNPSLWLIGLDAATGEPVLERQRKAPAAGLSPNFVDLAYYGGA